MLNEKKILTEILKQWIKDRPLGTALDGAQRFVTANIHTLTFPKGAIRSTQESTKLTSRNRTNVFSRKSRTKAPKRNSRTCFAR